MRKKTVTKWVGYVYTGYSLPSRAYIFQAEFIETDKQYQLLGGRKASGKPDDDACRALSYRTRINKGSNDSVFDSWDAAYAALIAYHTYQHTKAQAVLDATQRDLNAVLKLEKPC